MCSTGDFCVGPTSHLFLFFKEKKYCKACITCNSQCALEILVHFFLYVRSHFTEKICPFMTSCSHGSSCFVCCLPRGSLV